MTEFVLPILISLIVAMVIGPFAIPILKRMKFGQVVRDDGPKSHLSKSGTPTMGGFIILIAAILTIIILTKQVNVKTLLFVAAFAGFGLIGFLDDFIKVVLKRSTGLRAWQKAVLLLVVSAVLSYFVYNNIGTQLRLPFSGRVWDIGWWIIPLSIFVLVSTTNSANLTDGLDGLLGGINLVYFLAFAVIFAFSATAFDAELLIISASVAGATLGFLFYNSYPAKVFMGDTGSLAIGGAIGMIALLSGTAIWIPFMVLMTVASSVSVIIQVGYYKKTKKRVFKMAPLHHHFEQLGYPEMKITSSYVIITAILCMIGIIAIK